ncbi:hypothetical protein V6B33_01770 [Mangrovibacillus sp. Mu-81]|jgi:hypothetical protein|uniref:hypothetical protein n=1 Tax=Mangrovibacillus sp. Mu-81 TaxID=3121478 RepID=UPI002FE44649
MDPKEQEQNRKLRKVQKIYRRKKNSEENKSWTVFVGVCMLVIFFFLIMSALFDLGVQLPSFFGR